MLKMNLFGFGYTCRAAELLEFFIEEGLFVVVGWGMFFGHRLLSQKLKCKNQNENVEFKVR